MGERNVGYEFTFDGLTATVGARLVNTDGAQGKSITTIAT